MFCGGWEISVIQHEAKNVKDTSLKKRGAQIQCKCKSFGIYWKKNSPSVTREQEKLGTDMVSF